MTPTARSLELALAALLCSAFAACTETGTHRDASTRDDPAAEVDAAIGTADGEVHAPGDEPHRDHDGGGEEDARTAPDGDEEAGGADPLSLMTPAVPEGSLGRAYTTKVLRARGGTPPYAFAVVEGRLPDGLALGTDGTLAGEPEETGRYPFVVEVTDGATPPASADRAYELVVPRVILLSGYGPFAGYPVNPSWTAVDPLDGERVGDFEVRTFPVTVVWDVAAETVLDRVASDEPSVTIASGVAGGRREAFSLETTARNIESGTDVEGNSRSGTPCVPGAPFTLPSALPLDEIGDALSLEGVQWEYSDSAGTYLCNHLFYELVWATQGSDMPAGFIHVSDSYHSVADLTAGWRVILQAVADLYATP